MKRKIYIEVPFTDIVNSLREEGKITTETLLETQYKGKENKLCLIFESEEDLPIEEIGKENLSEFLGSKKVTVRLYNAVLFSVGHTYSSKNKLEYDPEKLEEVLTVNNLLESDSNDLIKFRTFGPKTMEELQILLKNEKVSDAYPIMRKIL